MPLFTIWRDLGGLSEERREALIPQAITASVLHPSVIWLRTYGLAGTERIAGFCVYEAPGERELREHHTYCRLPISEIRQVEEEVGGEADLQHGGPLFLVESAASAAPLTSASVLRSYRARDGFRRRIVGGAPPPAAVAVLLVHPSEWADVYDSLGLPHHWALQD